MPKARQLGCAGWTNDQLRKEVELGASFIFPADTDAVFNSDPGSLWPEMIGKTEQKLADSEPASQTHGPALVHLSSRYESKRATFSLAGR